MTIDKIEKHVSYSTSVSELTEAFVFVMSHVEEFKAPSIQIQAFSRLEVEDEDETWTPMFGVSVSGTVEIDA